MTTIQNIINNNSTVLLAKADPELLTELQIELKNRGYYKGLIDGENGPQTQTAWNQFKKVNDFNEPDVIGAGSLKKLLFLKPTLIFDYQTGYTKSWENATINRDVLSKVDWVIENKIIPHQSSYQAIQKELGIPWYVVAVIHSRESDFDFGTHLFNGDPLNARTVNEPAGMPLSPEPPYTWHQGAIAALQYDGLDKVVNWGIANTLYTLERYNGLGYWKYNINSPYIWAGTNQYSSGKYVSDGRYDPDAVDEQLGCAAILKRLFEKDLI
jgi:lysozyme family protein